MSVVDIKFPIRGKEIPHDYSYYLYAALSSFLPQMHGKSSKDSLYWDNIRLHPINARRVNEQKLGITKSSYLTIRCDQKITDAIAELAYHQYKIGPNKIRLGKSEICELKPQSTLHSSIVVFSGVTEKNEFIRVANQLLSDDKIHGDIYEDGIESHSIRISNSEVIGFSLSINNLDDEHSLVLQANGLGGRGNFGCGVFTGKR